jgi:hypothetical protein
LQGGVLGGEGGVVGAQLFLGLVLKPIHRGTGDEEHGDEPGLKVFHAHPLGAGGTIDKQKSNLTAQRNCVKVRPLTASFP